MDCALCAKICPVECIESYPDIQPAAAQLEAAKAKARGFALKQRTDQQAVDARMTAFVAAGGRGEGEGLER